MIDLTFPSGALTADARLALVDELSAALLRAERAPDNDFFRSVTWTFVHELPADAVFMGQGPVQAPIFRVEVTTPHGALSDRRRGELVEAATAAAPRHAGLDQDAALQVWVLCHEVPEGSWGAGGRVVEFEALRQAAASAKAADDQVVA